MSSITQEIEDSLNGFRESKSGYPPTATDADEHIDRLGTREIFVRTIKRD